MYLNGIIGAHTLVVMQVFLKLDNYFFELHSENCLVIFLMKKSNVKPVFNKKKD